MLGADESAIYEYLKTFKHQYVSARQIARKAGNRRRSEKEPHWALPVLTRMVRDKVLETDSNGGYRLAPEKDKKHKEHEKAKPTKEAEETMEKAADNIHLPEDDAGPASSV